MENQLGIGVEVLVTGGYTPRISKIVGESAKYWRIADGSLFTKDAFNRERGANGRIYFLTTERKAEILREKIISWIKYEMQKINWEKCSDEELAFIQSLIKKQSSVAL